MSGRSKGQAKPSWLYPPSPAGHECLSRICRCESVVGKPIKLRSVSWLHFPSTKSKKCRSSLHCLLIEICRLFSALCLRKRSLLRKWWMVGMICPRWTHHPMFVSSSPFDLGCAFRRRNSDGMRQKAPAGTECDRNRHQNVL